MVIYDGDVLVQRPDHWEWVCLLLQYEPLESDVQHHVSVHGDDDGGGGGHVQHLETQKHLYLRL
jgi:hypothetical protein